MQSHLSDVDLAQYVLGGRSPAKAAAVVSAFGSFADFVAAPDYRTRDLDLSEPERARLHTFRVASARLHESACIRKPVLSSWNALLDYLAASYARLPTEEFHVLYLDRKNVLIADECTGRGTVDHAPVYPREIAKQALLLDASAVILVHNHPSGDPTPSRADIDMTREVVEALRALRIAVHDHIVVGRQGHSSFKTLGLL